MARGLLLPLALQVLVAPVAPKATGDLGAQLLQFAAAGREGEVQTLLRSGASLEAADGHGRTALIRAAADGHDGTVQLLLDRRAEMEARDDSSCTALIRAAGQGQRSTVELLLDGRANVEARSGGGSTPLVWAASGGHEDTTEVLLDRRADMEAPDHGGRSALMWAARKGHKLTTKLLLERRADMEAQDKDGWNALIWAADRGQESTAELLLDRRADMEARDKQGSTPLIKAAFQGHQNATELLLDRRADPEAQDRHGWTALMRATEDDHKGTRGVQQLLLEHRADLARTKTGSELIMAAGNGHDEKVKKLLDDGAKLEARDGHGQTPLIWASLEGRKSTSKLLLERRAHLEAFDHLGATALMWAANSGQEEIVQQLIKHGANPAAKDAAGLSAADYALSSGHFHVLAAVPQLQLSLEEKYRHVVMDWRLWLGLGTCSIVVCLVMIWNFWNFKTCPCLGEAKDRALHSRPSFRMGTRLLPANVSCSRAALQVAAKALFSWRARMAAKAFRGVEVFINLFLPMRLMLVVRPELCLPAFGLAYALPSWCLSGNRPWEEPLAMLLVSARESLLLRADSWTRASRCFQIVGIARALVMAGLLWHFTSECQAGEAPWYCNLKGKEVTHLLQHNQQQTLCLGFDPLDQPWRVTGACEVNDTEGCIMSPNYPKEYGANTVCTAESPRFSAVYTEQFHTEHHFDKLTINNVSYSGTFGPPEVFVGGSIWGCLLDPPNITFRSDAAKFGYWKLCRRKELCLPMLPVKDWWGALNAFALAAFCARMASVVGIMLWSFFGCSCCCGRPLRSATREEVLQLAKEIDKSQDEGSELQLDPRVQKQLLSPRFVTFTMMLLCCDMILDLNSVNTLLLHLDFMFAFCIFTAVACSTALEFVSGNVRKLRENWVDIKRTGIPTDAYLKFIDQEHGTEALVSLLVTFYALPFAIRTPLQMMLTMMSLATSMYGVTTLLHERIDLLSIAAEDFQGEYLSLGSVEMTEEGRQQEQSGAGGGVPLTAAVGATAAGESRGQEAPQ